MHSLFFLWQPQHRISQSQIHTHRTSVLKMELFRKSITVMANKNFKLGDIFRDSSAFSFIFPLRLKNLKVFNDKSTCRARS